MSTAYDVSSASATNWNRYYQIEQGQAPQAIRHAWNMTTDTISGGTPAVGDTVKLFPLGTVASNPVTTPYNIQIVIAAWLECITPIGTGVTVMTVNIGDGASATQYFSAYNIFAMTTGQVAMAASTTQKAYQTTDYAIVTINTVTATGIPAAGTFIFGVLVMSIPTDSNG